MLKLLLLLVAAYAGFDLIRTLRTGRARIRITTVTRKHQPARYWRYVYSGIAVLVVFVAAFIWAQLYGPTRSGGASRSALEPPDGGRASGPCAAASLWQRCGAGRSRGAPAGRVYI